MHRIHDLCTKLRDQGRRVTPQRRAIIQILVESDGTHPTAEQVFARAQDTMPDMSPATIYNTLHELVEMDVLSELELGIGGRHYDLTTENHAHLVCMACKRVEDVPFDHEKLTLSTEHSHGFQMVNHSITFRGYCPDCASQ